MSLGLILQERIRAHYVKGATWGATLSFSASLFIFLFTYIFLNSSLCLPVSYRIKSVSVSYRIDDGSNEGVKDVDDPRFRISGCNLRFNTNNFYNF
jgi:hypothetical protein